MTNREIAQEISNRIGTAPVPFDSVYSIALEIYHQLGGEESQFDSVYSILLEILPLVEGGSGKAIEIVDELPEASENKEKFYRLSSDDNVYVSELKSRTVSEPTNRLPDEQQIDKGYIYQDENIYYYNGQWTLKLTDGEVVGYGWIYAYESDSVEKRDIYLTQEDAEHATGTTKFFYFTTDEVEEIDIENHIIIDDDSIESYQWEDADTITNDGGYVIHATYNAPESAQIGNAFLNSSDNIYTGEEYTFTYNGVTYNGYKWGNYYASSKPASEIYFKAPETQAGFVISDTIFYSIEDEEISNPHTLYIQQLNAPDSEQIRKAYIEKNGTKFYYRGECNVQCTNGSKVYYWWCSNDEYTQENAFFSEEPANSIYTNAILALNTSDSHDNITYVNEHQFVFDGIVGDLEQDFESYSGSLSCETVKYQRTVVTEVWDWKKVATEQYVDDAIAEIPQLEAGQNVEIADNKIAAKGYFYDEEKKEESKLIDDILHDAGLPAGQSLGLKVSGAAGATTYTFTDEMGNMFAMIVQMGMLPGVGATYQTANGKSGVIASIGKGTITFEETLDADNALTNEPVDYVVYTSQIFSFAEGIYDYIDGDISTFGITLSGAAGATTYTYTDNQNILSDIPLGSILKLQDDRSAKLISIDNTNNTASFETTFDVDNALTNALIVTCSNKNYASGNYSHVEGGYEQLGVILSNIASGKASHSEGGGTTASGLVSHTEGFGTTASSIASHAEGFGTTASGEGSHAEGKGTTASEDCSHAEGKETTASGLQSHAEGNNTTASGEGSHAEGIYTVAGSRSHAEGVYNLTQNQGEHAEGWNNRSHKSNASSWSDAGNTLHSIGIGQSYSTSARGNGKNAVEVMTNGDMYVLGVGGYQGTDTKVQDATIKTLQEYIASLEARIAALENPNA